MNPLNTICPTYDRTEKTSEIKEIIIGLVVCVIFGLLFYKSFEIPQLFLKIFGLIFFGVLSLIGLISAGIVTWEIFQDWKEHTLNWKMHLWLNIGCTIFVLGALSFLIYFILYPNSFTLK